MNRNTSIKTATYEIENMPGWFVDIVKHETGDIAFDAWLYHESIGAKMYIVGDCRDNHTSYGAFVDMIGSYLFYPGEKATGTFFDFYEEEYMQD